MIDSIKFWLAKIVVDVVFAFVLLLLAVWWVRWTAKPKKGA